MIVLETPRMYLRRMVEADWQDVLRIVSDPEAMKYYPSVLDEQGSRELVQRNLNRYHKHGIGLWLAVLKESRQFAGQCGLVVQTVEGKEEIEIGYMFLRSLWGQGLASEAAAACRDYGFNELGLQRLISLIDPNNVASRRVAEHIGMTLEREAEWQNKRVCVYTIHA